MSQPDSFDAINPTESIPDSMAIGGSQDGGTVDAPTAPNALVTSADDTSFGDEDVVVTTEWELFSATVSYPVSCNRMQLAFNFGKATGTVWIDDVTMSP